MAARQMTAARLEAISDGVIAVAITIMVLSLNPPRAPTPAGLLTLWQSFVAYLISFAFVAIYWVNHRYVFRFIHVVDEPILWSSLLFLFFVTLIPFGAAYIGQTELAPFPVAVDGAIMLICALSFTAMRLSIARRLEDPAERALLARGRARALNFTALAIYVLAVPVAFVAPLASLAMNFVVTLAYMSSYTRPE